MSDNDSAFRKPFRVIKWLGYNTLQEHPLVRMLHEARASETAREKLLPPAERRSYQIRQQRVYARGREYTAPDANAIAKPPEPPAAAAAPAPAPEPVDHLLEMREDIVADDRAG